MSAIRTNDSYLQAQYQRLRHRIGDGCVLGAVKHSIICACWHMLSTGELYKDLGGDYGPQARSRAPDPPPRRPTRASRAQGQPRDHPEAA